MATIIKGATTLTPLHVLVDTLEAKQDAATIEHVLLDGRVLYSLRPDAPREGKIVALFGSEADAETARDLLATAGPAQLVMPERPTWAMTFARWGPLSVELEPPTVDTWRLSVGFREVIG